MPSPSRFTCAGLWLILLTCGSPSAFGDAASIGPSFKVYLRDGSTRISRFRAVARPAEVWLDDGTSLDAISRLERPPALQESLVWLPLRCVCFSNGDCCLAQLRELDAQRALLIGPSGNLLQVPRSALAAIENLPGHSDLLCVDHSRNSPKWRFTSGSGELRSDADRTRLILTHNASAELLPSSERPGEVTLWLKLPEDTPGVTDVVFELATTQRADLMSFSFHAGRDLKVLVRSPFSSTKTQLLPGTANGWMCIRVAITDELLAALDSTPVLRGPSGGRSLKAIRVIRHASDREMAPSRKAVELGTCWITETVPLAMNAVPLAFDQGVTFHTGDQLFGEVASADNQHIALSCRDRAITVDRSQVRSVRLIDSPAPLPGPVSGWLSRVDLQPLQPGLLPMREPKTGRLHAAIVHTDESGVEIDHPSCGTFRLPWDHIRSIEPLFPGRYQIVDVGPRHLGNQIRPEFLRPEPEGTRRTVSVEIDEPANGRHFLSLTISDLEPSGSDTLRGSRTLKELRAGFLVTNVLVNGQLAGRLNDAVSTWSTPHQPQRVRIALPARLLIRGTNTIEFQQVPSQSDDTTYDDCEIQSVAIETEQP